ncbi:hypothetical protein MBLNU13_g06059t1 [Cladosporium sp. NU13]
MGKITATTVLSGRAGEEIVKLTTYRTGNWIFWIYVGSSVQSDAGLRQLADDLKLPGREDPYADVPRLIEEWLGRSGRRWLLVLDDINLGHGLPEPSEDVIDAVSPMGFGNSIERMINFLATCPYGQTIMTTRCKEVALQFTKDQHDVIPIGVMEKADAIMLFQSRTSEEHDKMDVERLVVELGCVPQAITYAAAFIESKEPPHSIRTYLGLLSESVEYGTLDMLNAEDSGDRFCDLQASNKSALRTWRISFDHLVQMTPSAADRLFLIAFLDHRRIPESLTRTQEPTNTTPIEVHVATTDSPTDPGLDEDIAILLKLHLISVVAESKHLSTHPFSQLATRQLLRSHDKYDHWQSRYIKNLAHALPPPGPIERKMSQWRKLFPHAHWALTVAKPQNQETRVLLAKVWHEAAWYLCQSGDFRASAALLERCWTAREQLLGDRHPHTLLSLIMLGGAQELLGNQDEAREIFQRCLTSAERYSDLDQEGKFALALCLEKTAITELDHEQLEEAETHLKRALGCYDDLPGYDRFYDCISALKEVLLKRGKSAEARDMCRQALARCTETHGNEHSYTAIMSKDLVEALRHQGDLDEGMAIAQRILVVSQRRFGVDDRQSLGIMWEIAQLLRTQRKYQEAADLLERVHRMSSDRYGKESIVTLGYAHSYARALKKIGKVDEALEVMRACATSTQRKLGADHRDTIKRTQLVEKLEEARNRPGERFVHEIRLERQARRKEKLKCIVQ